MKPYLFLLLLPIYFFIDKPLTGLDFANLKGKVKKVTTKSYTPAKRYSVWVKNLRDLPLNMQTEDYSIDGRLLNFRIFIKDSVLTLDQTTHYDAKGVVTDVTNFYPADHKKNKYVVTKNMMGIMILEMKSMDPSGRPRETIAVELNEQKRVKHSSIRDKNNKVIYQVWNVYNKQRDQILTVSRTLDLKRDSTTIEYTKYDTKGNWIQKIERLRRDGDEDFYNPIILVERSIQYY